jgi:hypothetical protein
MKKQFTYSLRNPTGKVNAKVAIGQIYRTENKEGAPRDDPPSLRS